MTILGQDSFSGRTVSGSWGTASDGQVWSEQGGIRTVLAVSGGEGTIHGGNSNAILLLGSGTATDQDATVRLALGQVGDVMGLVLRSSSDGTTYYECEIGNYTNDIEIAKVVNGSFSSLNIWVAGFTIGFGPFCFIRFQVIGDTLRCKIWPDDGSTPESASWTGTVTDSTIASGQYGLFANSFDVVDMQFDHYLVTDTNVATSKTEDLASRLRVAVSILQDLSARARLSAQRLSSLSARLNSAASISKNISSRVKAQATARGDMSSREHLQASIVRSLSLRLLFSSSVLLRVVSARLLLLSVQERNLATLFRSQATSIRSLAARTLLQVTQIPSVATRLLLNLNRTVPIRARLAAQRVPDIMVLAQLAVLQTRSVASRLLTLASSPYDITALLSLSARRIVGIAMRMSLRAQQVIQIASRVRTLGQQSGVLSTRVRSRVLMLLSLASRLQSAPGVTLSLALRALLVNVGIQQRRSLFLRFQLKKVPTVYTVGSWSSQPSAFLPGSLIAIPPPAQPYRWNGIALDMPSVRTAPMDRGRMIAEGSTFLLLFNTPSIETQAYLVDDSIGELSFAVSAATLVQGQVHLSVTRTEGIWQVLCTTLSPILVKTGL